MSRRKEITKVVERDADGLVVTTEKWIEGDDDDLTKAAPDPVLAEFADAVRAERAEQAARDAAREQELQDEAEWIRKQQEDAAARAAALGGTELVGLEVDEVSVVDDPAHQLPGWLRVQKHADRTWRTANEIILDGFNRLNDSALADERDTAVFKAAGLPTLTQAEYDRRAAMTTDEFGAVLEAAIERQPPVARTSIRKFVADQNRNGSDPAMVEALAKAYGPPTDAARVFGPVMPPGAVAPAAVMAAQPRHANGRMLHKPRHVGDVLAGGRPAADAPLTEDDVQASETGMFVYAKPRTGTDNMVGSGARGITAH